MLVPIAENALPAPKPGVLVDPNTLLEPLLTLLPWLPKSPPVFTAVVVDAPKRFLLTPLVPEPNIPVPPVFPGTEPNTLVLPVLALPNREEVVLAAVEAQPPPNNPDCELC